MMSDQAMMSCFLTQRLSVDASDELGDHVYLLPSKGQISVTCLPEQAVQRACSEYKERQHLGNVIACLPLNSLLPKVMVQEVIKVGPQHLYCLEHC